MSKILLVADVHIGSYSTRNPGGNDYRLYQGSRTVAENIIKVGKQQGCEYIAFAGDVIEKSVLRPYVLSEVKRFLDRVMSEFRGGWLIYGNHCLDSRSSDQDIKDSLLGVILPPNLIYAHQTTACVDGVTLGFSNYQPTFDLSWIQGKVDYLITHATICYTPSEFIQSQELDESKFDLAFCGDIHKKGTIGKYVSIGIPQKCKMGDSDECSGVVLDCATRTWSYVDLNPDNNLMKFAYTQDLDQSGWHQDIMTWLEYKPALASNNDGGVIGVESAAEKVEELFSQYIQVNNLLPVHQMVLSNVKDLDSGCIDFDFTLTKFWCKNWRSIEEVTVYFNRGDKILIVGENGAGKSSLTSAIKLAFVDVRDIKDLTSLQPFVQFGTKECVTEVEFIYQGNQYRLRRGTKEWGLWINDVPQKFSNKRAFEDDARARFPFIQYIDVFFLDADHNQLIGGMSVEKKSLIVSKFFKLDKIDTLHDTAVFILKQLEKEGADWRAKINTTKEILRFIDAKLSEIECPAVSKASLEQSRREGMEIQRKSNEWSSFVNRTSLLTGSRNATLERINLLAKEVTQFRALETIDSEILAYQNQISGIQQQISSLGSIKTRLDYKVKEIEDLRTEGNNAFREVQEIGIGKTCKSCGQVIQTSEALLEHKRELEAKISELKEKKVVLDQELAALQGEWNNASQTYQTFNYQISELNQKISTLMLEKNNQARVLAEADSEKAKLTGIDAELQKLVKPEEVYLPENFMATMSTIEAQINAWNQREASLRDQEMRTRELESYNQAHLELQIKASELQKYIDMTGPTGEIYHEILTKLAKQFSDGNVNYEVRKYTNRGEHLNLESQFNNNGNWVDYAACSSGQKTVLDVHFLQNIVSRLGLLVMDEFLKHLDPGNHDVCIEMISKMNIGCIMLSSHMESVASFNNHTCRISLNKDSMSEIELT